MEIILALWRGREITGKHTPLSWWNQVLKPGIMGTGCKAKALHLGLCEPFLSSQLSNPATILSIPKCLGFFQSKPLMHAFFPSSSLPGSIYTNVNARSLTDPGL